MSRPCSAEQRDGVGVAEVRVLDRSPLQLPSAQGACLIQASASTSVVNSRQTRSGVQNSARPITACRPHGPPTASLACADHRVGPGRDHAVRRRRVGHRRASPAPAPQTPRARPLVRTGPRVRCSRAQCACRASAAGTGGRGGVARRRSAPGTPPAGGARRPGRRCRVVASGSASASGRRPASVGVRRRRRRSSAWPASVAGAEDGGAGSSASAPARPRRCRPG